MAFDPYHSWLGIPPHEQPPTHYRLLGLRIFESSPEVIENAAERNMAHIRSFQTGRHSELSQRLLNEVSKARICLLDDQKRAQYDESLRESSAEVNEVAEPVVQEAAPANNDLASIDLAAMDHEAGAPMDATWSQPDLIERLVQYRWILIGGCGVLILLIAALLTAFGDPDNKSDQIGGTPATSHSGDKRPDVRDEAMKDDSKVGNQNASKEVSGKNATAGSSPGTKKGGDRKSGDESSEPAMKENKTGKAPADKGGPDSIGQPAKPALHPANLASSLNGPLSAAQMKEYQTIWAAKLGVPVSTSGAVGIRLVLIPPGEFMMGSPDDEPGRQDDRERQIAVRISNPFYMGATEITQAQYSSVMSANPSTPKKAQVAVNKISWFDATQFCARLSNQTGKRYRLPTEAEWEYACRAGTTTSYYVGDDEQDLRDTGNYADRSLMVQRKGRGGPFVPWNDRSIFAGPVGQYAPNPLGLYDMYGNVWEWCGDWFVHERPKGALLIDPKGPADPGPKKTRVVRGGGWGYSSDRLRSASRNARDPNRYKDGTEGGFRVVVEL